MKLRHKIYIYLNRPKPYDKYLFTRVSKYYREGDKFVVVENGVKHYFDVSSITNVFVKDEPYE